VNTNYGANVEALPERLPGPDYFIRVPDNEYDAAFIGCEGFRFRGIKPKVAIWFRLINVDRQPLIAAYYNALTIEDGSARIRNPEFTVGWRSRLARDLANLYPERYSPTNLPTAVPAIDMRVNQIRLRTRTVTRDMDGIRRAPAFHSSVVCVVIGWIE